MNKTKKPNPGEFAAYFATLSGRRLGAFKSAACKIGIPFAEYTEKLDAGLKWCHVCRRWLLRATFVIDRSRWDGLSQKCSACAYRYDPLPEWAQSHKGPARGRARDGDKLQARASINRDVKAGRRPDPNDLHCAYCGHKGVDRRHEYHHHMGYAAAHHNDVLPACSTCHHEEH